MVTVTIPKKEYDQLVEAKLRYEYLRQGIEQGLFSPPPTRNRNDIVRAFTETKKYHPKFIKSLTKGLKRSSYFRA